jgi:hypothetical protein
VLWAHDDELAGKSVCVGPGGLLVCSVGMLTTLTFFIWPPENKVCIVALLLLCLSIKTAQGNSSLQSVVAVALLLALAACFQRPKVVGITAKAVREEARVARQA